MARKHKHEDHTNHEAWAIPYGDLITLLLAFFVVMYAVSSVNEGKYRVLADSLSSALGGPPRSLKPIQIGDKPEKGTQTESMFNTVTLRGFEQERSGLAADTPGARMGGKEVQPGGEASAEDGNAASLQQMADEVQSAMGDLIDQQLVIVRRNEQWLEIEINTDILFPSGVAQISPTARPVLARLASVLKPFPHPLRIEGHTDNMPISTVAFPSNWELSAARAATVVHLFMQEGVDAKRMTVAGMGEFHPVASNETAQGRDRNRRVVIVVLAPEADGAQVMYGAPQTTPLELAPGATATTAELAAPIGATAGETP
ncbi:flagellar motor protein MotD [Sinimarinibacterium sp. CAU 1509]|uniref:flagellar motor protein MotD n=1 Tax=Sinimarinibacterium sp. CAU 1509 TaxID=2562283 RepID=UPI0010AD4DBC|nr:flagellar motor protein MotD [Sinimarinibacterium sp. CAU 1509]TJY62833.1 flagellar motor protein MotD [Sinimarinibacterium sp. CAU 1509]